MNFKSVICNFSNLRKPLINYQTVRWRKPKKPFWLGIAKSKMFVVKEPRIKRTNEEMSERRRLDNEYFTQIKSLLNFLTKENPLQTTENVELGNSALKSTLMKEIEESHKRNESWNAECAKLREARTEKTLNEYLKTVGEKLQLAQEKEKEQMEKIEKLVKEEKMKSASFVTFENLDESIEKCLNEVVEYNYAIDRQGNKYEGRDPIISTTSVTEDLSEISNEAQN